MRNGSKSNFTTFSPRFYMGADMFLSRISSKFDFFYVCIELYSYLASIISFVSGTAKKISGMNQDCCLRLQGAF